MYYSTAEQQNDYESIDEWYKLVLIKELSKEEIDVKTGTLVCNEVRRTVKEKGQANNFGAIAVWRGSNLSIYPYYYGGLNNIAVVINNSGNLPTHCTVKIEAETDTPLFRIIQDGKILEQAKYNVYVRNQSYLIINSDPAKQEASLYTGANREDVYYLGEKDYTYSNFITIPSGESMFLFTARNSQFGRVTLSYSLQKELYDRAIQSIRQTDACLHRRRNHTGLFHRYRLHF